MPDPNDDLFQPGDDLATLRNVHLRDRGPLPTEDELVAPHHYRLRVADRYRDVDVDAKRADELGRHALSIWLHGQAEAYAQSMVELVGELSARQTWRTRASEHSQATEEALRALRADVTRTITAACSTELPQPVQL